MRARLVFVPVAVAAAILAGCATKTPTTSSPTSTPVPSATTVADNGIAALSAEEILAKATQALAAVPGAHAKGEMNDKDQKARVDVTIAGGQGKGTIFTSETGEISVVHLAKVDYLKFDDKLLKDILSPYSKKAFAAASGKYLKFPGGDPAFKDLVSFVDPKEMLKPSGKVSKGDRTVINGVPAIMLIDDGPDGGVLYIATTGTPYPIRMGAPPSAGVGGIDFDYPTDVKIVAPAASEVVTLESLVRMN
jgi:hypothetical protein